MKLYTIQINWQCLLETITALMILISDPCKGYAWTEFSFCTSSPHVHSAFFYQFSVTTWCALRHNNVDIWHCHSYCYTIVCRRINPVQFATCILKFCTVCESTKSEFPVCACRSRRMVTNTQIIKMERVICHGLCKYSHSSSNFSQ